MEYFQQKMRPWSYSPITFLILIRLQPDQNQWIAEIQGYLMVLERISDDTCEESYKRLKFGHDLIF